MMELHDWETRHKKMLASFNEAIKVTFPSLHPHTLVYNTHLEGHRCDVCGKQNINTGYRCKEDDCDFDCCNFCCNKQLCPDLDEGLTLVSTKNMKISDPEPIRAATGESRPFRVIKTKTVPLGDLNSGFTTKTVSLGEINQKTLKRNFTYALTSAQRALLARKMRVHPAVIDELDYVDSNTGAHRTTTIVCKTLNLPSGFMTQMIMTALSIPQIPSSNPHRVEALHPHQLSYYVNYDYIKFVCSKCEDSNTAGFECLDCNEKFCFSCYAGAASNAVNTKCNKVINQICQPNEVAVFKEYLRGGADKNADPYLIALYETYAETIKHLPLIDGYTRARTNWIVKRDSSYDETKTLSYPKIHEHKLVFNNSLAGIHNCNGECKKSGLREAYRCKDCDFDLCMDCAAKIILVEPITSISTEPTTSVTAEP